MRERQLAQKKNDWVLYAWVIRENGGQIAFDELVNIISLFPKRDSRRQRIGQILGRNKRRGFLQLETNHIEGHYVSIWAFDGDLPSIPDPTERGWRKRIDSY
jgi:hypothetical protein